MVQTVCYCIGYQAYLALYGAGDQAAGDMKHMFFQNNSCSSVMCFYSRCCVYNLSMGGSHSLEIMLIT